MHSASPSHWPGWKLKGVAYSLSATCASVLLGGVLGLGGSVFPATTRLGLASVLAVAAVVLGILDMSRFRVGLPQCDRETPHRWLYSGPFRWATLNGAALGVGFTSRLGFWLWYVVPISTVLSGNPVLGALIYGSYGLVRGCSVWLQLFGMMRQGEEDDLALRLMRLYPRVRSWTAAVLIATGTTSAILLGF